MNGFVCMQHAWETVWESKCRDRQSFSEYPWSRAHTTQTMHASCFNAPTKGFTWIWRKKKVFLTNGMHMLWNWKPIVHEIGKSMVSNLTCLSDHGAVSFQIYHIQSHTYFTIKTNPRIHVKYSYKTVRIFIEFCPNKTTNANRFLFIRLPFHVHI